MSVCVCLLVGMSQGVPSAPPLSWPSWHVTHLAMRHTPNYLHCIQTIKSFTHNTSSITQIQIIAYITGRGRRECGSILMKEKQVRAATSHTRTRWTNIHANIHIGSVWRLFLQFNCVLFLPQGVLHLSIRYLSGWGSTPSLLLWVNCESVCVSALGYPILLCVIMGGVFRRQNGREMESRKRDWALAGLRPVSGSWWTSSDSW